MKSLQDCADYMYVCSCSECSTAKIPKFCELRQLYGTHLLVMCADRAAWRGASNELQLHLLRWPYNTACMGAQHMICHGPPVYD